MTPKDRITADLKEAMKAGDTVRREALRAALSGFSYRRIESGKDPDENEQLEVLRKAVKQRADSIAEYEKAGRTDLVEKEAREREILLAYLPAQKSPEEIRAIVREALAELPADGRNQGALMKLVMPRLKGLADGNTVREIATAELAG